LHVYTVYIITLYINILYINKKNLKYVHTCVCIYLYKIITHYTHKNYVNKVYFGCENTD